MSADDFFRFISNSLTNTILMSKSSSTSYPEGAGISVQRSGASFMGAQRISVSFSLAYILFGLGLSLYLITHLVGLEDFPIYFFTDEAAQTVLAADFIRDGLRGSEGELLPTYFQNHSYFNLSASVYLQVLPYLLFGKSIFVTRATSAVVSLLVPIALSLILKNIFRSPYWWSAAFLLSVAPAWFLHSRTAFETVLFVSFYAVFLYLYLLYRYRASWYLYPAVILAALAFYTYSPGQVIIVVTALSLAISDIGHHWQNRHVVFLAGLLTLLLATPYLRFQITHPIASTNHLRLLDSYLLQPIPLSEKVTRFFSLYSFSLSPAYWFSPHDHDLPRHTMNDYGHLLVLTLPLTVLGLFVALKHIRQSKYRVVLIALISVPFGSALVGVGITRLLGMIVPLILLTADGLSHLLIWFNNEQQAQMIPYRLRGGQRLFNWSLPRPVLSIVVFTILSLGSIFLTYDALSAGPTWSEEYGIGGMQYGAEQVFDEIEEYLQSSPDTQIILSPTWANGTDVIARFFLPDPLPIQLGSVDGHLAKRLPLDDSTLFITTPQEYKRLVASGKFTDIRVEKELAYPNGKTGFYFLRLRYVDDIELIFAKEKDQRRELREDIIFIDGEPVRIKYSYLDIGEIQQAFDNDRHTLTRTFESNPFIIELDLPSSHHLSGLAVVIGSVEAELTLTLGSATAEDEIIIRHNVNGTAEQPHITLTFPDTISTDRLRLEVRVLHQNEEAHVHIWEVQLISSDPAEV